MEVEVCTWWSPAFPPTQSLRNVTLNTSSYELCLQAATSTTSSAYWHTYLFVSNSNAVNVTNIDVMQFVRYLHQTEMTLSGYYITAIYFGYRIYTGKGNFLWTTQPQIQVLNVAATPTQVVPPNVPTNSVLVCSFSQFNITSGRCYPTEAGNMVQNILTHLMSTPDLVQLLRLSPFVVIIDELSYYAYHTAKYDRGFIFIAELSWEVNNGRWVPSAIADIYQQASSLLSQIQIEDWANRTPPRFIEKGDTVYFLNNAQDFLFVTAPLAIIFFLLAWWFCKKMKCWKIRLLMAPFATFSYLLVSLFGDNIQYLSFRAFQQLRFIVPKTPIETFSIILALSALFIIVVCGCALYIIIWALHRRTFGSETMRHTLRSFVFLNITLTGRTITGFIHAYIDNERLQVIALLMVAVCTLLATSLYVRSFKVKRNGVLSIAIAMLKVLISLLLLLEVEITFDQAAITPKEESFSGMVNVLIYSLAVCFLLQYIVTSLWGFCWEIAVSVRNCCQNSKRRPKKIIKMKNRLHGELDGPKKLNKG